AAACRPEVVDSRLAGDPFHGVRPSTPIRADLAPLEVLENGCVRWGAADLGGDGQNQKDENDCALDHGARFYHKANSARGCLAVESPSEHWALRDPLPSRCWSDGPGVSRVRP